MISRIPHAAKIRGTAVAATVVAASAAVTVGVAASADEAPHAARTEGAVTRIGDLPPGASVTRGGKPAGQVLGQVLTRQRRAARAAHEARARRARARSLAAARTSRASRSVTRAVPAGDPRGIARSMMSSRYGWGAGQFSCLSSLWQRESGWNVHASNPSGAYGIPQALPGSKMAGSGPDWQNNAATQIAWGLSYIKGRYGTPCGAWSTFQSQGWY